MSKTFNELFSCKVLKIFSLPIDPMLFQPKYSSFILFLFSRISLIFSQHSSPKLFFLIFKILTEEILLSTPSNNKFIDSLPNLFAYRLISSSIHADYDKNLFSFSTPLNPIKLLDKSS